MHPHNRKPRTCQSKLIAADFLRAAAAIAAASAVSGGSAHAADTSKTLVIASPATPQGLDGEYDVSLGTVDSTGALYDNLIAYKKIPDPASPDVMREDIGVHPEHAKRPGAGRRDWLKSGSVTRTANA